MGANDAAEMLEAAKAENVRLEQALTAIRDLMQPAATTTGLNVTAESRNQIVTFGFLRTFANYSMIRTHKVRSILEAAGYPVTFPTPEDKASAEAVATELEATLT